MKYNPITNPKTLHPDEDARFMAKVHYTPSHKRFKLIATVFNKCCTTMT